jgi:PIN domain nuclease of toxin-antitoxin system
VVLLDTHVWLWSIEGDDRRIGRRARALLARAEALEQVRVSPVSLFEVAALHALGRLRLSRSVEAWIRDSLAVAGVRVAEVTPPIAIDAGGIPRLALADPLDRLLVATARHLNATMLTADRQILDYASRTSNVEASDASM